MSHLRVIEPDYDELLQHAHRRWIIERTPEAADLFDRALWAAVKAARDRALPADGKDAPEKKA